METLHVEIRVRPTHADLLPTRDVFATLRLQHVVIHRADITSEGLILRCEGEPHTLRMCAQHLASHPCIAGVSMQRTGRDV